MAVEPRKAGFTRDDAAGWLADYRKLKNPPPLREYILKKVGNVDIDTRGHEDLEETTPLVDMILMDLTSYGADDLL